MTRAHPHPQARRRTVRALALLLVAIVPAACGGGGTSGETAPPSFAYLVPDAIYRVDEAIAANTPTTVGALADFAVSPALPAGLDLDVGTGAIEGAPLEMTPRTLYDVTASSASGPVMARVTIEVRWPPATSLAAEASLDDADLRHFLIRTHWGITDAKLDDLETRGLPAFLSDMLAFPAIGSTTWEQEAGLLLRREDDPVGQEGLFPSRDQLTRWWLFLMKENPNPFQEVLALAWHDHFATSSIVLGSGRTWYMKEHVNLLREKGNGNVRDLLVSISRDAAMMWWLDGRISTKYSPNENYAREYLELFCLGVDKGYDQTDIVELSRAFTGYQDVEKDPDTKLREVVFVPSRHDETDKVVFGVTIPGQAVTDDYEAVVDLTIAERDVASWLALRLLTAFCCPEPDPVLVAQLAQVLEDADYEIAPVLRTLFLSEAFFSDASRRSLTKSPVDHALGFMRATGLVVPLADVQAQIASQGNVPTLPPSVDGWPAGVQWLSAQAMVDRANLLQLAISDSDALREQQAQGLELRDLLPPGTPTSLETAAALALRLGVHLEGTERTRLALYLDTERLGDGSVVASPFDPADPNHIDERVRGLLYVLGQHPTFMVR